MNEDQLTDLEEFLAHSIYKVQVIKVFYVHDSLCYFQFQLFQHSAVQSHPYFCFYCQKEVRVNQANQDLCCICIERKKTVVFLPCRHMCTCEQCSDQVLSSTNKCPMCNEEIVQRVVPFK